MSHLTLDEISAYVSGTLDEAAEERVDLHLADCDACATLTRSGFDVIKAVESSWTAASHAEAARGEEPDPFSCPTLETLRQVWEGRFFTKMTYLSGGACPVLLALVDDPEGWRGVRYARIGGTWMASLDYDPSRQEDPTDLRPAVAWILRAAQELARESLMG